MLAPEFTANGFARYEHPLENATISTILSFNVQGSHFFDITNSDISRQGTYALLDARVSYIPDDSFWQFNVFVENLTDEEYLVYTFDFTGIGGFNQLFFGRPLTWGVSLDLSF